MRAIWLCIAGNLLLRLANSATGVLMGLLLASIDRVSGDVPATAVGLLAASFYLAELLGAPWFGVLSDRYGARWFMAAGPVFGGIAIQLIGWPSLLVGWPLLLIAMGLGRVIEGLSTASSAPSTLSFLSAHTSGAPALRGRIMAWYEMATVVGIGGGFVAGGLLWDNLGYGAFLGVSAIYATSFASFAMVHEQPKEFRVSSSEFNGAAPHAERETRNSERAIERGSRGSGPRPAALLEVLRRPRVFRFAPAWLLVNTVVGLWFTHSAFQLTGEPRAGQYLAGGFTGSSLGAAFAYFSAAFLLGVYLWGMAIGTRRKTTIMAITASGIYLICAALFAINHLGGAGGWSLTALGAAYGVGVVVASGFTPAALAYLADISEEMKGRRGAVMGLYSVMLGLGQLLGGVLGGPFADIGGIDGLILLTALLGTGALATVLALRHYEERLTVAAS